MAQKRAYMDPLVALIGFKAAALNAGLLLPEPGL